MRIQNIVRINEIKLRKFVQLGSVTQAGLPLIQLTGCSSLFHRPEKTNTVMQILYCLDRHEKAEKKKA